MLYSKDGAKATQATPQRARSDGLKLRRVERVGDGARVEGAQAPHLKPHGGKPAQRGSAADEPLQACVYSLLSCSELSTERTRPAGSGVTRNCPCAKLAPAPRLAFFLTTKTIHALPV